DHPGAAWHGAKIGECGALCSTNPVSGVIEISFDADGFTVSPLAATASCTPYSVSAHMLYENSDPLRLVEPGGTLDVSQATYHAVDERSVHVTGSQWQPDERYTVKLEGARLVGYQTSALVLLRQPRYVAAARQWSAQLHEFLVATIQQQMSLAPKDYDIEFRLIGVDATLGPLEQLDVQPSEVGVLMLVTAESQDIANDIARLCNPYLLHYPLTPDEELPTFAFPYSPAESARGALYEFALNHVMQLNDPMDAFRLQVEEINHA
ncbi:MAG: acyclic terpene utilization AtuA family protein, partial [Pseudomonadota bacterium]